MPTQNHKKNYFRLIIAIIVQDGLSVFLDPQFLLKALGPMLLNLLFLQTGQVKNINSSGTTLPLSPKLPKKPLFFRDFDFEM